MKLPQRFTLSDEDAEVIRNENHPHIWGFYRNGYFVRHLDEYECEFINCAIAATLEENEC